MLELRNPTARPSTIASQDAVAGPPTCLACGRGVSALFPRQHPWLFWCLKCGLGFTYPQPSDAELSALYSDEYYRPFGVVRGNSATSYHVMKQRNAERVLRYVERSARPGRMLDIGSAFGDVLVAANRRGWSSLGIEPNRRAAAYANQILPRCTICSRVEEIDVCQLERFDVITCFDVFEHLRDPERCLAMINELLSDGGHVVFTVPNIDSVAASVLGHRWPHFHRDHLWYFSKRTMSALLARAGFDVVTARPAWKVFTVEYITGVIAAQGHLGIAAQSAKVIANAIPRQLQRSCLPPLPEGLLVIAKKTVPDSTTM